MMPQDCLLPATGQGSLVEYGLYPHILLGMPHLTPFGLARTWLLKELGHRHWLLLGRSLGLDNADFRTPAGEEAYAAITALKVDARLSRASANAVLTIRSNLYSVSNARMESVHRLAIDGMDIGIVVLQSVFVARTGMGNSSIRRALVRHFLMDGVVSQGLLTEDIAGLRLWNDPPCFEREMTFHPCPFEEFNGAGLFYFAEFAALVSHAFSAWEGNAAAKRLDTPLSMLFFRNIEAGEALRIGLHPQASPLVSRRCTIQNMDGSVLSRIAYS
jgi:probable biosynthetic protein (TIGR04099 family)